MVMRVAIGIHGSDIDRVIEMYNLMSERYFTHASPTLFNAGTLNNKILVDKSNHWQKNLGTIKSLNLCTEIIEYSAPDETAVCNLTSLALPSIIVNGQYDFH